MTLAEFCRAFGGMLAGASEGAAPALAAEVLPGLLASPMLLNEAQRTAPRKGYGRHCVFACPQDRFSVLAMVWPAGFTSPVHDHEMWCAFGVYEGVLGERRYEPASAEPWEGRAALVSETIHQPGDVAHLPPDVPDIHAMYNPTDRPTISIHVYGGNADKLGPNLKKIWSVQA